MCHHSEALMNQVIEIYADNGSGRILFFNDP